MMLSTEAAVLAIEKAKGLIKITGRVDVIPVEKEAIQGSLAFPVAEVSRSPAQPRVRRLDFTPGEIQWLAVGWR
jgi:hypothetical protein